MTWTVHLMILLIFIHIGLFFVKTHLWPLDTIAITRQAVQQHSLASCCDMRGTDMVVHGTGKRAF